MGDVEFLMNTVPLEYLFYTLLVIAVVAVVLSKLIPWLRAEFVKESLDKKRLDDLERIVESNTMSIKEINRRLDSDSNSIHEISSALHKYHDYMNDSLDERELIIKSLLGIVKGLQELGADGPTVEVENELNQYLLDKTHDNLSIDEWNLLNPRNQQ